MGGRTHSLTRRRVQEAQALQLDLGCGARKRNGFFGVDTRPLPGVDLVHNLEETPWPLPDDCASLAVMSHVYEHLKPWTSMNVLNEAHRVLRHDAILMISGPYGLGFRFVQDPTHCNPVNEATFAYFDPIHPSGLWSIYTPSPWHIEAWEIVPANGDRDFEVALRCCKKWDPEHRGCSHGLSR